MLRKCAEGAESNKSKMMQLLARNKKKGIMTSVIIPEFIYDGIASAPAGQVLSGGFGMSVR